MWEKIVASWTGTRSNVKLYRSENTGEWIVVWHSVLSSGSSAWGNKKNAIREYNKHVPKKHRILIRMGRI